MNVSKSTMLITSMIQEAYQLAITSYAQIDWYWSAKKIFHMIISAYFLHLHHNLFPSAFVFGFIFSEQTAIVADKVNTVYQAHSNLTLKNTLFWVCGGLFAFHTLATSRIFATIYCAANWGARLYENSNQLAAQTKI